VIDNDIKATQLFFELEFSKPISRVGFTGSTLRGGFGYTFRKIACGLKNQKSCCDCILFGKCVYSVIFESPVPSNSTIMRKYQYSPHPFVFSYTDDSPKNSGNGLNKIVSIIIIGKAIDYIPYFIYTMKEFGNTGFGKSRIPFKILRVCDKYGTVFYSDSKWLNPQKYPHIDSQEIYGRETLIGNPDKINVEFITPCRIKYNDHFVDSIEFHVLIRSLLRRISELSYFYCDKQIDIDYSRFINQSQFVRTTSQNFKWIDFKRYSTRQKQDMKMGGVVGSAVYEGDIKPFLSVLLWGELLHVGKGTSFGLGKYKLTTA